MTSEMRVFDAAMLETDELGIFIETENTAYAGVAGRAKHVAPRLRIGIPDRFFDAVAEAKTLKRRLRIYYKWGEGVAVAELVELV